MKQTFMPDIHTSCKFNSAKECVNQTGENRWLCEYCKIPNHYGIFFEYDKRGKLSGKQKFILDQDREARLSYQYDLIEKARKEIEKIHAIPTKEQYERSRMFPR